MFDFSPTHFTCALVTPQSTVFQSKASFVMESAQTKGQFFYLLDQIFALLFLQVVPLCTLKARINLPL